MATAKAGMIDQHKESLISLKEGQRLPTSPSQQTLRRLIRRGRKGIKLEHIWIGGKLMTSIEAFDRFIARTNGRELQGANGNGTMPQSEQPHRRR